MCADHDLGRPPSWSRRALAAGGISCNALAAFHHGHLLVPHERAEEVVDVLARLSRAR